MKIKYLGTASSEGCPSMFCNCENCKSFRAAGGKNLRGRTQAVIDNKILVDFHGDTFMNFQRFGLDASAIKYIFITHTHEDHWDPLGLLDYNNSRNRTEENITIYGNQATLDTYERILGGRAIENIQLKAIEYFQTVELDGYKITPLIATHTPKENCFIYLIEKDGKTMLYCNDTGIKGEDLQGKQLMFSKENLAYMQERNIKLDFLGLDCTYGTVEAYKYGGHMSLYDCAELFRDLQTGGFVREGAKTIVTHFSHWNMLLHDDFQKLADEFGFEVAYDGIEIEI